MTWYTGTGWRERGTDRWRSANASASSRKHGVMTANFVMNRAVPRQSVWQLSQLCGSICGVCEQDAARRPAADRDYPKLDAKLDKPARRTDTGVRDFAEIMTAMSSCSVAARNSCSVSSLSGTSSQYVWQRAFSLVNER